MRGEKTQDYLVLADEEGQRLDVYLADKSPVLTRSQVKKFIEEGRIAVNEKLTKAGYKVRTGDAIRVIFPPPVSPKIIEPEAIPLNIIYEDEELIVINKDPGMVVHPAPGHCSGTLVNALLYHCQELSGINGDFRPGIVHRLDKDTSGLLVAAKNDRVHQHLARQLKERKMKRGYWALVHGRIKEDEGIINVPLGRHPVVRKKMAVREYGGRPARTRYMVQERFGKYTLVEAFLDTGRTHQIRVHLAYIKHPVVGDPQYGFSKGNNLGLQGQFLHARVLKFQHPLNGQYMHLEAPLPIFFEAILKQLRIIRHEQGDGH